LLEKNVFFIASPVNSQLTITTHIFAVLAHHNDDDAVTSDMLAKGFGTNPVAIRRVLSKLKKAGLVASCRGAGGGSVVAKSADIITFTMHMPQLLTIRRAVLGRHTCHRADGINITPIIGDYANDLFQDEEQALLKSDQPKGKL
jgi:DNA-binding IscR family transcriptional regulator